MLCIILILIKISKCFFFVGGGGGWGVQTSHLLYFAFPAPAHFLDLLHFRLFLLQNIKHCCILSPCFSCFPPYWNSHLPLFPLPPPIRLFSSAANPLCSPALFKCTPRGSLKELETMEKTSQ